MRHPEIDQIAEGIFLDLDGLRQEEERLQDLEAHCIDADERNRIRGDWNRIEDHQTAIIRHGLAMVRTYRKVVNGVLAQLVKSELSYADCRKANDRRGETAVA